MIPFTRKQRRMRYLDRKVCQVEQRLLQGVGRHAYSVPSKAENLAGNGRTQRREAIMRKGIILIIDGQKVRARKLKGKWLEVEREEVPGLFERLERMVADGRTAIEHGMHLRGQLPEPDKELGRMLSDLEEYTERQAGEE